MASNEELEAMGISNNSKNNNNNKNNNNDEVTNTMAQALRFIGFIEIIASLIAGFSMFEKAFYVGISLLIGGVIGGIFSLGFAEVIQLLQDIKNK